MVGEAFSDVVPRSAALISILLRAFVLFLLSFFFRAPFSAACVPVIMCSAAVCVSCLRTLCFLHLFNCLLPFLAVCAAFYLPSPARIIKFS